MPKKETQKIGIIENCRLDKSKTKFRDSKKSRNWKIFCLLLK